MAHRDPCSSLGAAVRRRPRARPSCSYTTPPIIARVQHVRRVEPTYGVVLHATVQVEGGAGRTHAACHAPPDGYPLLSRPQTVRSVPHRAHLRWLGGALETTQLCELSLRASGQVAREGRGRGRERPVDARAITRPASTPLTSHARCPRSPRSTSGSTALLSRPSRNRCRTRSSPCATARRDSPRQKPRSRRPGASPPTCGTSGRGRTKQHCFAVPRASSGPMSRPHR